MNIASQLKRFLTKPPSEDLLSGDIFYKNIRQDHRIVEPQDIFVAVRGNKFDGHIFLNEVCKKNPAALVVEDLKNIPSEFINKTFVVENSRLALDALANAHFGWPSEKLFCVGVTGTNGKTTVSHLVEFALNAINIRTAVIGTIDHHFIDAAGCEHKWETQMTSPGSLDFYSRLKDFVSLGAMGLSVEVSSHALEQDRMSSCQFDGAIFTNLTRDHLDYHKDMDSYFAAKEKLFSKILFESNKRNKFAVINVAGDYGKKINIDKAIQKITYGHKDADLTYEYLEQALDAQKISVKYKNQKATASLKVFGSFNMMNVMAATAVLLARGISLENAIKIFENFKGVRGRLQKIENTNGTHVFVDYAHTPDALENVLNTLREAKGNKNIITVFGCGGDRDKGKRPHMGRVTCKLSDHVIITSDNPRSEDPKKIVEEILAGCSQFKNFEVYVDRRDAIFKALDLAKSGDIVLVAGKGHETYQIIGDQKKYFDDVNVIEDFFKNKK